MDPIGGPSLVRKRDGRVVEFDTARLAGSIARAAAAAGRERHGDFGVEIARGVVHFLGRQGRRMVATEEVREMVESLLREAGHADVAARYREHARREAAFLWTLRVAPSPRSGPAASSQWDRERLASGMIASDVPAAAAREIARSVERKLVALGESTVSPGTIHELARMEIERRGLPSGRYSLRRTAFRSGPTTDPCGMWPEISAARRRATDNSREVREALEIGILNETAPIPRRSAARWTPSPDAGPEAWLEEAAVLFAAASAAAAGCSELHLCGIEAALALRGRQWLDALFRCLLEARRESSWRVFPCLEICGRPSASKAVIARWAAASESLGRPPVRMAHLTGPAAEPDAAGVLLADADLHEGMSVAIRWESDGAGGIEEATPVAVDLSRLPPASPGSVADGVAAAGRLGARFQVERAAKAPGGRRPGTYPVYLAGLDSCLTRLGSAIEAGSTALWRDPNRIRAALEIFEAAAAVIGSEARSAGIPITLAGVIRRPAPATGKGPGPEGDWDGWFERAGLRIEPEGSGLWEAVEFRRQAAAVGVSLPLAFPHAPRVATAGEWAAFFDLARKLLEPREIVLVGGGRAGEVRSLLERLRREPERHPLLSVARPRA
ncbi:MAG: ATP cone domain-containing protein [Planctomycetota bacterium]|nr:ATP cone domain-containing protein [Planctomycetota bacterium]